MRAPVFSHHLQGYFLGNRRLIHPFMDKRIIHVKNRHDPRRFRNVLAGKTLRIARPVPFFMVRQGDLTGHLHQRNPRAAEYLRADGGMSFDNFKLLIGQPARLKQDIIRHADFSDIMHAGGDADFIHLLSAPAELFNHQKSIQAKPAVVGSRFFVPVFACRREPQTDFLLTVPYFFGPLLNIILKTNLILSALY